MFQSLGTYSGRLLRDTMHGIGEYRCRYRGETHEGDTYEGYFYNNCMHGYGLRSYANGRVFSVSMTYILNMCEHNATVDC